MKEKEAAEALSRKGKAGEQPDPVAAPKISDGLALLVTHAHTSRMGRLARSSCDDFAFTHLMHVATQLDRLCNSIMPRPDATDNSWTHRCASEYVQRTYSGSSCANYGKPYRLLSTILLAMFFFFFKQKTAYEI